MLNEKKQMHGTIIFHYLASFLINFIMRFTSNFFFVNIHIEGGKNVTTAKNFYAARKKLGGSI
jgi:hypothetical protein